MSDADRNIAERRVDSVWRHVHDVLGLHATGNPLAALEVQVIYVFTHDSVGLGEDGPTHQPIEHLVARRSIPAFIRNPAG